MTTRTPVLNRGPKANSSTRSKQNYARRLIDLSIVICTRNRGDRLGGTLASLALLRSTRAWEVLIVDNASTDDTPAVLARIDNCDGRLRVIRVDRIGLGAARDAGWRATYGAIVAFTDDDCYPAPDFVDRLLEVFEERPELACVGGRILLHDPTDYPVTIDERTVAEDVASCHFVRPGALAGANLALRRSALEAIDGFDLMLGAGTPFPCEDIDVVAAVAWAGFRSAYDPRPMVRHHHGRKAADVPELVESYDRGRGAYFTKYLLRRDSRPAYVRGWCAERFRDAHGESLATLRRELMSGYRYILRRRAYAAIPLGLVAATCFYGALLLTVVLNRVRRRTDVYLKPNS